MKRATLASLAAIVTGGSCSSPSATPSPFLPLDQIPPQCNPIVGTRDCASPWPSAFYEVADSTTATGFRVNVPAGALPETTDMPPVPIDPGAADKPGTLNAADGFSPATYLVLHLPNGVSATGLPTSDDPTQSLDPAATVQILDMAGKRQLSFAEPDVNAATPAMQALLIRPLQRLQPASRYVVVVTRKVLDATGKPYPVPPGMQALLDGTTTTNAQLEALRPRYQQIFAATDAAGIARSDILVAWDYTTSSDTYVHSHLLAMRDAALTAYGDGTGWTYTITSMTKNPGGDGQTLLQILGTYQVPCFLNDGFKPDSRLVYDATGKPMMTGKCDAEFAIEVPAAAAASATPLTALVYGHGLLGNAHGEPASSYVRGEGNALHQVVAATTWYGLSSYDIPNILEAFTNLNNVYLITDKLQQAVVDTLILVHLVHGPLRSDANLQLAMGGGPVLSPTLTHTDYYGISLGGIMGDTFAAYTPDIAKFVLGVPGGNWSLLFERSSNFPNLAVPFVGQYLFADEREVILSLMQSFFDFSDPISTAANVLANPLPGIPAGLTKQVLLQEAAHDSQVNNLTTEMVARSLGVPLLTPSLKQVAGLTAMNGPLPSALTFWDQNLMPFPPDSNQWSSTDNMTHGKLRLEPAVKDQIAMFFASGGQVVYTCHGTAGCACYPNPPDTACSP